MLSFLCLVAAASGKGASHYRGRLNSAKCNFWAPGRTRDLYFEILGASLLPLASFDAFSMLGIFHTLPPVFTLFCSPPPHPLFSMLSYPRREGKGEVANSDFAPFCLGIPENAGVT